MINTFERDVKYANKQRTIKIKYILSILIVFASWTLNPFSTNNDATKANLIVELLN